MPKSSAAITWTSLPTVEEWLSETERQLTPLYALTAETLSASKQEPESYKQLLEDLRDAEEIRKREAAIVGEKAQLQGKFGARFNLLETDWQEIVAVLEWVKKVQAAFLGISCSAGIRANRSSRLGAAPSSLELTQMHEASLKVLRTSEPVLRRP